MATNIITISNTTTSTQAVAATTRRSGLRFVVNGAITAFVLQGAGTASSTNKTFELNVAESGGATISPPEAREAFQVVFETVGTGSVVVTETIASVLSGGAASYPLLTIIQESCDLLGLPRPATVISSTDATTRQLLALAVEEANELAAAYGWQSLVRECTFTTVADAEQTNALPDDLDRFISNSFFNRTTRRPVVGPITAQQWQAIQANPAMNRIILAFRERDRSFIVTPSPASGETIAYEYITNEWATSSDGLTTYTRWSADTDLTYLDAQLIKLGVRWRWKKTKGLPYNEDYDTYQVQKQQKQARDGGSTSISLSGPGYSLGNPNLPEGNFGS